MRQRHEAASASELSGFTDAANTLSLIAADSLHLIMRISILFSLAAVLLLAASVPTEARRLRRPHRPAPPAPTPVPAPVPERSTNGTSSCGFGGLDFSSLQGLDISGSDSGSTYSYLLSLCGPLSSEAAAGCLQISSTASACQLQTGQSQSYDVGNWVASSPPTWSAHPTQHLAPHLLDELPSR